MFRRIALGVFILSLCQNAAQAQFGAVLTGVGPINRSMGGAATAAPLDTLGAFMWNPATITALPSSTDFGLEVLLPHAKLSSTVGAGSLAPGFPPVPLSGSDKSASGAFPLPEFGAVYQPEDSPWTFGAGLLTVAGFSVNFPGDPGNPILSPPPPAGLGVGPIFTQYMLMQFLPTVAVQATERLSLGFSPIVDIASLSVDPGVVAAPDAAGGTGFATFPALTHGTYQWGAGFQLGAFYASESNWNFGVSFKSTQWFNSFQFNSKDQTGAPRNIKVLVDAPMIVSLGTSYTGFQRWLLAADVRYIDYRNTRPFSQSGFDSTGAIKGLGFDSIFALSTGVQFQATDAASLRVGYSFSTNPISNADTFFNIASSVIIQHGISVGASYNVTQTLKLSLAYCHFFENSISGPFLSPLGAIPGTSITSQASADSIIAGASFKY
jgi:long-chain fatty acid transport protein